MKQEQKHGIPALLSFVCPGLGQIVKGELLKGIGMFFTYLFSWFMIMFVVGVLMVPIVWVWAIWDAYNAN